MSFRLRQVLVTALAVPAAIALASALVYLLVRDRLGDQVDEALRERAAMLVRGPFAVVPNPRTGEPVLRAPDRGPGAPFQADILVQAVSAEGEIVRPDRNQVEFPVSRATLEAAQGTHEGFFSDATVTGTHVRLLTLPLAQGYALQLGSSLEAVDEQLREIGLILLFVSLGGIGVAAVLGGLVARAALAPVRRLTREAEIVTETQDLARRIDVRGDDELARLGSRFNTMLGALAKSQAAQRQLVADASHELRTPLTSLRTNIEVLARRTDLLEEKREALLRDLTGQLEELSELVTNLVELASERPPDAEPTETQLDVLVQDAVDRAARLAPQVVLQTELEESVVRAVPARLERAIANLLDNAVKWSPRDGRIEVRVLDGEVTVRDHGPGIAEEDLRHVFDRFYRAASARPLPGSGLGLSIVREVVDEHGGTVTIERPEGGGTLVRLRVPTHEASGR